MRHPDDQDYEYDETHIGPCTVLIDSAVDIWSGNTLRVPECKAKATDVVFEDDYEDPSYVCKEHALAWVKHGETAFHAELDCTPVTEQEVQEAIASILGSAL